MPTEQLILSTTEKEVKEPEQWTTVIKPHASLFSLNLKEVWQYRDLLTMYVKRDVITTYKQTILGPVWFFVQPIFTTIVFMFVFGGLAGIPTDGIPQALFYLAGICLWTYFADTLTKTADTFSANQGIFGKVYFPRLVAPLSVVITNLLKFLIQLALFFIVYGWYLFKGMPFSINVYALLFPLLLLLLAGLGLGFGLIISAMTTKYRDLKMLLVFGVQLWMYATPVIYPLSVMQKGGASKYVWLVQANPLTAIIETFKYGFLGQGYFSWAALGYTVVVTIVVLLLGVFIFNRTERSFMDVI